MSNHISAAGMLLLIVFSAIVGGTCGVACAASFDDPSAHNVAISSVTYTVEYNQTTKQYVLTIVNDHNYPIQVSCTNCGSTYGLRVSPNSTRTRNIGRKFCEDDFAVSYTKASR